MTGSTPHSRLRGVALAVAAAAVVAPSRAVALTEARFRSVVEAWVRHITADDRLNPGYGCSTAIDPLRQFKMNFGWGGGGDGWYSCDLIDPPGWLFTTDRPLTLRGSDITIQPE